MKSERLAYWYFRLNGFLTSQNYIIHPKVRGSQRTEIDILGVRFPYKAENLEREGRGIETMSDEEIFDIKKTYIIIAEAKKGKCSINEPLLNRDKKNIPYFLRIVGAFREEDIDNIANELYSKGSFANESYYVSLFCVGAYPNSSLSEAHPEIHQITWDKVLEFIYTRFDKYDVLKRHHPQWDCSGQQLWHCFERNKRNKLNFKREIISCLE